MTPACRTFARLMTTAPDWLARSAGELWQDWLDATTLRGRLLGVLLLIALSTLPAWGGPPLVAAMITVLWLAYAGQSWNLLAGFAGLFSLGHALFIGLGGYLAAAFTLRSGLGPWPGAILAVPLAALAGAFVGALGCRAGLKTVHFTLVTLILAEGARLGVLHLDELGLKGLGAAAGLDLPASPVGGKPVLFYYGILALTALALLVVRLLLRSRLGYGWLAVREDPRAAAAMGIDVYRARITATAVSAALAAPAGVFLALYLRHADPEQMLSLSRSLGPLLGTAIGGIGTLVGPVLGAFIIVPADHALSWLIGRNHHDLSALKPLAGGVALVLVAMIAPGGLWPGLARRLGLLKAPPADEGDRQ